MPNNHAILKLILTNPKLSAMSTQMHCRFCGLTDHWMKNFETITCPKLKEKKNKEKESRRQARIAKNFNTPTQEVAPIKTSSNFTCMGDLIELEEQTDAAVMIQKHVRRCIAEATLSFLKQEKLKKKANKGKKKRKNTTQVYYDMPQDK